MENCGKRGRQLIRTRGNARTLCGPVREKRSVPLSVEMRACSACAGDYEDPDRTAWPADEENRDAEENEGEDEFPEAAS